MGTVYTGRDVVITYGDITARFKSIRIKVMGAKFEADASDTVVVQRGTGTLDASITIVGWDSDITGGGTFAVVAESVISKEAPSALSWTDTAGTPASKLAASFFTLFPLSGWRTDSAEGGSAGPNDPADWTVELTPNNIDGS